MSRVMMITEYGTIKWSDGNGLWDITDYPPLKRGFWLKRAYTGAEFIGETWEEAMDAVKEHFDKIIRNAQAQTCTALSKLIEFDEKNKMKVLDHIVSALESP